MDSGNVSVAKLDSTTFRATYTTGSGLFSGASAHVENDDTLVVTARAGPNPFENREATAKNGSLRIISQELDSTGKKFIVKYKDSGTDQDSRCTIL